MRIFISSVQKEFAAERKALAEYLSGDPLLRRFFETFLFERDVPASDRRPDAVYLDEVRNCDLYLGLLGDDYGWENKDGLSPCPRNTKSRRRFSPRPSSTPSRIATTPATPACR